MFFFFFFFFNDTATTEIYTLSLHDALPISRRDPGRADTHEGIEDEITRPACELDQPSEDPQRLLRRVDGVLHSLVAAADRRLDEVMHVALTGEVPGVPLVPAADDHLAAVQEARAAKLRRRIR